ncbi:MAG TPA: Yip1 family protein [Verrucomicrobiae bacterium]|nr:Yip1 family protein [Verrucomicrobiae bacterium]
MQLSTHGAPVEADFIVPAQKNGNHGFWMLKVFFLLFESDVAWEKIAQARRGFAFILGIQVLPLIALATAAEGWGLMHWGKWQERLQRTRIWTDQTAVIHFEILQAALFLAVVFLSALLLHVASAQFHGKRTFLQSFTVMAYAFSPMLLLHLLNLFPGLFPAWSWALGLAVSVWVLYPGIPRVLERDPVHAFGNYLTAIFVLALTSGLVRLFTAMYLLGNINFQRSAITRALGQWLGQ